MNKMKEKNIGLILVQIGEAHTNKWPLGFEYHPENHKTYENRIERCHEFMEKFPQFENVFIDKWNNEFEQRFQAWPDKFVLIDSDLKVLEKSEYSRRDALIINDYSDIIMNMV